MKADLRPVFNRKVCMACRICVDVCPVSCIETAARGTDKDPHGYPFLADADACIRCGQCAEDCPVAAVGMAAA
jgi:formate hydrogenlyase subunit 6/NADH:ubiquinone oxidoreductase subunit I